MLAIGVSIPTDRRCNTSAPRQPQTETKEADQVPKMSEAQKRAIYNLSRRRGISVDDLEKRVMEAYNTPLEELPSKDASEFIRTLQQAA